MCATCGFGWESIGNERNVALRVLVVLEFVRNRGRARSLVGPSSCHPVDARSATPPDPTSRLRRDMIYLEPLIEGREGATMEIIFRSPT